MTRLTVDECKRIISKGRKQLTDAENRIEQLEQLARDMWAFHNMPTPYMPAEIASYFDMNEDLKSRMEALGLMEGDGE